MAFSPSEQIAKDESKEIVNILDIYGNNALSLACVYNIKAKDDIKYQVIALLLKNNIEPNVRNLHTGFTPLHWCARHGELQNVKMLCDAGAK